MDDATPPTPSSRQRPSRRAQWASLGVLVAAAVGVLQFYHPSHSFLRQPLAAAALEMPVVEPSPEALGKSRGVKVRLALPGDPVEYPLQVQGDPTALRYQWIPLLGTVPVDTARTLSGAHLVAPGAPGFYRLALVRDSARVLVEELTLAVLVPFEQKSGPTLNGYKIGTYVAERNAAPSEHPEGFVEVDRAVLDLPISTHLRLADFLPEDGQNTWPRYVALNPRVLDKLELIVETLSANLTGGRQVRVDVNAGFRGPAYNRTVRQAARDSRHQYGDAMDVAIDADADGHFTQKDLRLVALAVDRVERDHPELAGGLGLYTSRRFSRPFVHIDARGRRARWGG